MENLSLEPGTEPEDLEKLVEWAGAVIDQITAQLTEDTGYSRNPNRNNTFHFKSVELVDQSTEQLWEYKGTAIGTLSPGLSMTSFTRALLRRIRQVSDSHLVHDFYLQVSSIDEELHFDGKDWIYFASVRFEILWGTPKCSKAAWARNRDEYWSWWGPTK